MAEWVKFVRNRDYRHKSRAVTAYKAGMTIYVPSHIARDVLARGDAVPANKPVSKPLDPPGDGRRVYVEDRVKLRADIADRFKHTLERLDD